MMGGSGRVKQSHYLEGKEQNWQDDGTLQDHLGPSNGDVDDHSDVDDDSNVDDDDDDDSDVDDDIDDDSDVDVDDDSDVDDDGVEQINIEISFFSAAAGLLCAAMGWEWLAPPLALLCIVPFCMVICVVWCIVCSSLGV